MVDKCLYVTKCLFAKVMKICVFIIRLQSNKLDLENKIKQTLILFLITY